MNRKTFATLVAKQQTLVERVHELEQCVAALVEDRQYDERAALAEAEAEARLEIEERNAEMYAFETSPAFFAGFPRLAN